jgi:hypothetical protein
MWKVAVVTRKLENIYQTIWRHISQTSLCRPHFSYQKVNINTNKILHLVCHECENHSTRRNNLGRGSLRIFGNIWTSGKRSDSRLKKTAQLRISWFIIFIKCYWFNQMKGCRVRSVGIARYRLNGLGIEFPVAATFIASDQAEPEVHSASCTIRIRVLSRS